MKTVAIVCEYNPFHNGHLYHIQKIREEFGEDTAIIAIMSGNYTQRGDVAIMDKTARAKCAVLGGANLVLELPFPYSMLSAEFFATAAVSIINDLGCVDIISFGSEDGKIVSIINTATIMQSERFNQELDLLLKDKKYQTYGYPQIIETALKNTKINSEAIALTPNNILGIEYVKALIRTKSQVKPHTIERICNNYDEENVVAGTIQSASAIRNCLEHDIESAKDYMPYFTNDVLLNEKADGEFPCNLSKISTAIIANFRLNAHDAFDAIQDANGGLYNRLREKSLEANDINAMLNLCETKSYTRSRLRRAMLTSFFGVTSSEAKMKPEYTQVLAFDSVGQAKLKQIKKNGLISVLTKPSSIQGLSSAALLQKKRSDMADSIFELTKPNQPDGKRALRFTPYVKK